MADSEDTDPSKDFSTTDYNPQVPEDEEKQQHLHNRQKRQRAPVQIGVNRRLTKIDSRIPQGTLAFEKSKVGDIKVEPGSFQFIFWFFIATEVPVITACIGPLANMISVAALVNRWRAGGEHNQDILDTPTVLSLNAISLALGCIANVSLILNFSQRLNYKVSQLLSVVCFMLGTIILLVAIIIAHIVYFKQGHYTKSEGFWFAVLTTILYSMCSLTCFMNFLGYLLGKYPAKLNLQISERGLIAYTFLLAVWFLWGAAMFSQLLHLSYGNGMYYCTTSLLTIGLGDITPFTNVTKGLSLVYSLSGVIILGLIIAMIRGVIVSSSAPIHLWNKVESERKKFYKRLLKEGRSLTSEESFELIRSIRRRAKNRGNHTSTIITIIVFVAFWLIGALVFHFAEGWVFFDAVYFCFLCLITIGYGDYAPKTAAGRTFFIVWALGAVPLMTALISNVGDALFGIAKYGMSLKLMRSIFSRNQTADEIVQELNENALDDDSARSIDDILSEVSNKPAKPKKPPHTKVLIKHLKKLIVEAKDNPSKRYSFQEWTSVMELLEVQGEEFSDGLFWISDKSPLSLPISEPNYILFLLFDRLEAKLDHDLDLIESIVSRRGSFNE